MDRNDNSKYYSRFHIRDQNIPGPIPGKIKENNRFLNFNYRKNKYTLKPVHKNVQNIMIFADKLTLCIFRPILQVQNKYLMPAHK